MRRLYVFSVNYVYTLASYEALVTLDEYVWSVYRYFYERMQVPFLTPEMAKGVSFMPMAQWGCGKSMDQA